MDIGCHCQQVVDTAVFVHALCGAVPSGAEFAAAAHIGQHKGKTLRQPMAADIAQIMRQFGHAEAAVHIHQRGRIDRAGFAHMVVRHGGAVGRGCLKTLNFNTGSIKLRRLAAQHR